MVRKLLTLLALALATCLLAAPSASAATPKPPPGLMIKAEAPYPHSRITGQTEVYGASSAFTGQVRSTLYQFFRGGWHPVAFSTSADGNNRVIAHVACTGSQTPYVWFTRAQVTWSGTTYTQDSRQVTLRC